MQNKQELCRCRPVVGVNVIATMGKVFQKIKMCVVGNFWFHIFSVFSLVLITASFICPPLAVIDGSVLAAVGEVFAFAALWTLIKAMDEGHTATLTHNDTTLTIDKEEEEENQ